MLGTIKSGGAFFDAEGVGDPVYSQHLIWLLGHPETWLMMGVYGLNLLGMFILSKRSHWGKTISLTWFALIAYSFHVRFLYFQDFNLLTPFETALTSFVGLGIIITACGTLFWIGRRLLYNKFSRSNGASS